jgi:hypothetical protein
MLVSDWSRCTSIANKTFCSLHNIKYVIFQIWRLRSMALLNRPNSFTSVVSVFKSGLLLCNTNLYSLSETCLKICCVKNRHIYKRIVRCVRWDRHGDDFDSCHMMIYFSYFRIRSTSLSHDTAVSDVLDTAFVYHLLFDVLITDTYTLVSIKCNQIIEIDSNLIRFSFLYLFYFFFEVCILLRLLL